MNANVPNADRYGLTPELFEELLELWRRLKADFGEDALAAPFAPVIGTNYGEVGAPKIMYIGKATEGWSGNAPASPAEHNAFAQSFYKRLYCGDYSSTFWAFIRESTAKLYEAAGLESKNEMEWALDRVIWSNLMKIGSTTSWPSKRLARAQTLLMEKLLRYELETHQPDAIMLTTNNYEREFVEKIFGTNGMRQLAEVGGWPITVIDVDDIGGRLYWTRHPQGWKDRWQAEDVIAADFGVLFR